MNHAVDFINMLEDHIIDVWYRIYFLFSCPPIFLASRLKGWSPGKSLIENLEC